jgi:drug/metabolite transporter (DMT)-like permease
LLSAGAVSMLAATFYFAIMNVGIKALSHLPVMEIVFFRCGVSLLLSAAVVYREGVDWKGSNRKLLILRGMFGTVALTTYFITIANMSLGTAVTIQYLSPIFTTILAIFVLGEKVKPLQWLFFIISFSGVLVMKGYDSNIDTKYLLIGLFSAITSAFAYNTIRTLKDKEHPAVVVLHFQLIGTMAGGLFSIGNFEMPEGYDWLWIIVIGVFTQLGQMAMTRALQQEQVANVSIINYTGVVYALIFGSLFFGEIYPVSTIAGILLVVSGVALSIIYRSRLR